MPTPIDTIIAHAVANPGGIKLILQSGSAGKLRIKSLPDDKNIGDLSGGQAVWREVLDRAKISGNKNSGEIETSEKKTCRVTIHPAAGATSKPWIEVKVEL